MNPQMLLEQIQGIGISVKTDGEKLFITPKAKLTDDLRETIRAHKDHVLKLLRWKQLAESNMDPDFADNEEDALFLSACCILRMAETREQLTGRWQGLKQFWYEHLQDEAMISLQDIFRELKGVQQ